MMARIVRFFGDAEQADRRRRLLIVVLVLVVAADFLVDRSHSEHFWQKIPGWGAVFGFVACVAIIFVSKFFGHKGRIMQREDYYD